MKQKIIRRAISWIVVVSLVYIGAWFLLMRLLPETSSQEAVLLLNEIEQLAENDSPEFEAATSELEDYIRAQDAGQFTWPRIVAVLAPLLLLIAFIILYFTYLYREYLRPFEKLEVYADNLARGNLDIQLDYEERNYFGKFTWAFDSLRDELKNSKEREQAAKENNKLIISTLSHDIKTPVATLRAYAEALNSGLAKNETTQTAYLNIMMDKADELSRLTDDLFLHALSEMDKLEVNLEAVRLDEKLRSILSFYQGLNQEIRLVDEPWPELTVEIDPLRFEQVIDNLLKNAEKYTAAAVDISLEQVGGFALVKVRDYGPGIADEDLPFILDKFYRGRNVSGIEGSGLGLYIVAEIMRQMHGKVEMQNLADGLEISLFFPLFSK